MSSDIAYLYSCPLVYGAAATPIDGNLDIEAEKSDLVEAISESKRNIKLRIDVATVDSLRDIVTHGVKILHYSGHGFENALALEDGRGGLHVNFSTDKLVPLFSAGQTRGIDIVFVAACNSEFVGKAFSSAGVPFVVAVKCASGGADTKTSGLISDKAARVFLRSFYLALLVGRSVLESFEIGRARVHSDPTPEIAADAQKFLIFNPSGHDSILFPAETTSRGHWDMINPALPSQIPHVPKGFVGRQADIHRLFNRLLSRRFMWLQGDKGIGKTATILAAAHYMHQRRACIPVYVDASKKLSTLINPGQAAIPLESRESIISQICFQIDKICSNAPQSNVRSYFQSSTLASDYSHALDSIGSAINFLVPNSQIPVLFILDHVEFIWEDHEFQLFISKLLSSIPSLHIVMASRQHPTKVVAPSASYSQSPVHTPSVSRLEGLSPQQSLIVSKSMSTRQIGSKDFSGPISASEIRNMLMKAVKWACGNPGLIIATVEVLNRVPLKMLLHLQSCATTQLKFQRDQELSNHELDIFLDDCVTAFDSRNAPSNMPNSDARHFIFNMIKLWMQFSSCTDPDSSEAEAEESDTSEVTPRSNSTFQYVSALGNSPIEVTDRESRTALEFRGSEFALASRFDSFVAGSSQCSLIGITELETIQTLMSIARADCARGNLQAALTSIISTQQLIWQLVASDDSTTSGTADSMSRICIEALSVDVEQSIPTPLADALLLEAEVRILLRVDLTSAWSAIRAAALSFQLLGDALGFAWVLKSCAEWRLLALQLKLGNWSLFNLSDSEISQQPAVASKIVNDSNLPIELSVTPNGQPAWANIEALYLPFPSGKSDANEIICLSQREAGVSRLLFRHINEPFGLCSALRILGWTSALQLDFAAARSYLDESKSISISIQRSLSTVAVIRLQCAVFIAQKELEPAISSLLEGIAIARSLGNQPLEASLRRSIADILFGRGQHEMAGNNIRAALPILETLPHLCREKALALRSLGQMQLAQSRELGLSNITSAVKLFAQFRSEIAIDVPSLAFIARSLLNDEPLSAVPDDEPVRRLSSFKVVSLSGVMVGTELDRAGSSVSMNSISVGRSADNSLASTPASDAELDDHWNKYFGHGSHVAFFQYAQSTLGRMRRIRQRIRSGIPSSMRPTAYFILLRISNFIECHPPDLFDNLAAFPQPSSENLLSIVDKHFSASRLGKHFMGLFVQRPQLFQLVGKVLSYDESFFCRSFGHISDASDEALRDHLLALCSYAIIVMPIQNAFFMVISLLRGNFHLRSFLVSIGQSSVSNLFLRCVQQLVDNRFPHLRRHFGQSNFDDLVRHAVMSTAPSLLATVLYPETLLRFWDCLFLDGPKTLMRWYLQWFAAAEHDLRLIQAIRPSDTESVLRRASQLCLSEHAERLQAAGPNALIKAIYAVSLSASECVEVENKCLSEMPSYAGDRWFS